MIRYKNKITIQNTRKDGWIIETDLMDHYRTMSSSRSTGSRNATPITTWWKHQYHSELHDWQKDVLVRGFGIALKDPDIELFTIYKPGNGYEQDHDMCLVHFPNYQLWVFATKNDLWIHSTDYAQFSLRVEDSLGSIENLETRQTVYEILNAFEQELAL